MKLTIKPGERIDVVLGTTASPLPGECRVLRRSIFGRKYGCGHRGPRRFAFRIWEFTSRTMSPTPERRELCPACLLEELRAQVIRCADCQGPILPGEPIGLPVKDARDQGRTSTTVVPPAAGGSELVVICCNGRCEGMIGFAGHWAGKFIQGVRWVTEP